MYVVMGGTGHVGSAVARSLLAAGERVGVITRDANKAYVEGAEAIEADAHDADSLRAAFKRGRRAFLLNPPASPETDTNAEELKGVAAMLAALEGSGLEKVAALSVYGARPGDAIGDLSVLYQLEQGLRAQAIPATIVRAAYYLSNFEMVLGSAREGVLPTMFPASLPMPMVAPEDIGQAAARLLRSDHTGVHYVEGPWRYTHGDVAQAFAAALGRPVAPVVTPRGEWEQAFKRQGFSDAAARSYARMTAASLDGLQLPTEPEHGKTSLQQYVDALLKRSKAPHPDVDPRH